MIPLHYFTYVTQMSPKTTSPHGARGTRLPYPTLNARRSAETNTPLARAVIGGLSVSTFLTLFLIPDLYVLFERRRHRREEPA